MPEENKTVLVLCDDLIFSSKISGEARAIGLQIKVIKTVDKLIEAASKEKFAGALIDLGIASSELDKLITEIRASQNAQFSCLGYGSHVDVDLLKKARSLGYDPVLPRSKFVVELSAILLSYSNNSC